MKGFCGQKSQTAVLKNLWQNINQPFAASLVKPQNCPNRKLCLQTFYFNQKQ
jgi:hypothetical protein